MCACMYVRTCVYICVYVCVHARARVYICVCVCLQKADDKFKKIAEYYGMGLFGVQSVLDEELLRCDMHTC